MQAILPSSCRRLLRLVSADRIGLVLLLGAQFGLVGCASCNMADIYKPYVVSSGAVTVQAGQTFAEVDIADSAMLRVGECSGLYEKTEPGTVDLCMVIWVADGLQFQWTTDRWQATSIDGRPLSWSMGPVRYQVYNKSGPGNILQPDSMPILATTEPVKATLGVQHPSGRNDRYEFDAAAAFVGGAASTDYPVLARLISRTARLRQYSMRSTVPVSPGGGFVLQLPGARVNGQPYDMPRLEFKPVHERVCLPPG